jgi:RNA polymerase sigma factor (sigma-70 family)
VSLLALRARALDGDADAADRLFGALERPVRKTMAYRLGARAELQAWCDDLVQDTLLQLWTALAECRAQDDAHLVAWARAAAKNRARSWLRRELPRCLHRAPVEPDRLEDKPHEGRCWPALHREVNALAPGAQEVLFRRLVTREEWCEVAEALHTTPGGARRRYERAIGRLRRRICPTVTPPTDFSR